MYIYYFNFLGVQVSEQYNANQFLPELNYHKDWKELLTLTLDSGLVPITVITSLTTLACLRD